jgi:photosystem II stability/assembly factor-like uncharacterized protein
MHRLAWMGVLAACHSPPVVRAAPPRTVVASTPMPEAHLFLPDRLGGYWVVVGSDGQGYVVVGTMRLDTSAEHHWADDAFATQIAASAEVADGVFVFAAKDGSVARAHGFLGALERLGEIPRGITVTGPSHGRLAVVDELGRAWSTDGSKPIARLATPEGTALDIAFADAQRGAVIVDGGALFVTSDRAQTWSPVDLGSDAAIALERQVDDAHPADYVLAVKTTSGMRSLYRTSVSTREVHLGRIDTARVSERLAHASRVLAAMRAGDPATYGLVDNVVVRTDPATRAELTHSDQLDGSECSLLAWGPRVIAACAKPALHAWSSGDGQHFTPLELGADVVPRSVMWSDDGIHAIAEAACRGDHPIVPDKREAACVRDARGWHTLVIDRADIRLPHGKLVLFHHDAGVLDLETNTYTATPLDAVVDHGVTNDLQWVGNGLGAVVDEPAGPDGRVTRSWYVRGPIGGPYTHTRLPVAAKHVSFADDHRGMVAGDTLDTVWRTVDGGASWQHVAPPVDGDARRIALDLYGGFWRRTEGLQCRDAGCWVGGVLVMEGWGPLAASHASVILARRPPAVVQPPTISMFTYLLRPTGCTTTRPAPARDTRQLDGPQGPATVALTARDHKTSVELAWKDKRGVARTSGPSTLAFDGDARFVLRATTSRGAWLERCSGATYDRACTVLWAAAGGAIAPVVELSVEQLAFTNTVVPARDGGVVAMLYAYVADRQWLDLLVRVAPTGKVELRWLRWTRPPRALSATHDPPQHRGLATYQGKLGYVFADLHDEAWLRFISLDRGLFADPINVPWASSSISAKCSTAMSYGVELFEPASLSTDGGSLVRARLTPAGWCAIDAQPWTVTELLEPIVPAARSIAVHAGTLTGDDFTCRLP